VSDGTYRGRWVDEVFRSSGVSAEVKVFLLFLAHYYMNPLGRVSEPRDELAGRLGCHPRKISAKFESAISAGLMRQVMRGQKGQTAVYQAVVPGLPQSADYRHPEVSQGAGFYHPKESGQGAGFWHPESAQGATKPHPEDVSGCQQPAPHIYTSEEVVERGDDGVVIPLFDEQHQKLSRKRSQEPAGEDSLFAEFYGAYPRKKGRPSALKAWKAALETGNDPQEIIAAAVRFRDDPERKSTQIRFTPYPAKWLNDERYLDEPEQEQARDWDDVSETVGGWDV
jgi:hypothetical protein